MLKMRLTRSDWIGNNEARNREMATKAAVASLAALHSQHYPVNRRISLRGSCPVLSDLCCDWKHAIASFFLDLRMTLAWLVLAAARDLRDPCPK